MPRGGARPGAGRKKNTRPTDQSLAGRVLEKAKAEEKWLQLLDSEDEHVVLGALKYLTDRHEGKAPQPIDLSARRKKLTDLIARLAGTA